VKKTVSTAETKEARKRDAMAQAELIYDMFKEEQQRENSTIEASDDEADTGNHNL
jgi:hypothetical protein